MSLLEWEHHKDKYPSCLLDIKTTRANSPIDHRSRVYRMLRHSKRSEMVTTIPNGTRNKSDCNTLHGQRGSDQAHKNANLQSSNLTCGIQMALHQGDGGLEATSGQGNCCQGESSGHIYETSTHEYNQQMEDRNLEELINDLFAKVSNEEAMF